MKFRSGFCCAAISRVRFQPKLSFRGGGVGGAGVGVQGLAALSLALGGADLGVAHIEHLDGGEAPGGVLHGLGLDPVLLHGVVVGSVLLQAGDRHMVVVIGHAVGQAGVHRGGGAGEGGEAVGIGAEMDHRGGGRAVVLAVPGEVQLSLILAGGQGHLGVIRGDRLPFLNPLVPGLGAAGDAAVVVRGGQRGDTGSRQGQRAQRAGQHSSISAHFV